MIKAYATFRNVRVEITNTDSNCVTVRALSGDPFLIIGSKYPYARLYSNETTALTSELSDINLFDTDYENRKHEDWMEDQQMYDTLRHGG